VDPSLSVASQVGSGYCDGGGRRRCAGGSIGLDMAVGVLGEHGGRVNGGFDEFTFGFWS
jgi:hypothetical protein